MPRSIGFERGEIMKYIIFLMMLLMPFIQQAGATNSYDSAVISVLGEKEVKCADEYSHFFIYTITGVSPQGMQLLEKLNDDKHQENAPLLIPPGLSDTDIQAVKNAEYSRSEKIKLCEAKQASELKNKEILAKEYQRMQDESNTQALILSYALSAIGTLLLIAFGVISYKSGRLTKVRKLTILTNIAIVFIFGTWLHSVSSYNENASFLAIAVITSSILNLIYLLGGYESAGWLLAYVKRKTLEENEKINEIKKRTQM
jgi:hypothetical protein